MTAGICRIFLARITNLEAEFANFDQICSTFLKFVPAVAGPQNQIRHIRHRFEYFSDSCQVGQRLPHVVQVRGEGCQADGCRALHPPWVESAIAGELETKKGQAREKAPEEGSRRAEQRCATVQDRDRLPDLAINEQPRRCLHQRRGRPAHDQL